MHTQRHNNFFFSNFCRVSSVHTQRHCDTNWLRISIECGVCTHIQQENTARTTRSYGAPQLGSISLVNSRVILCMKFDSELTFQNFYPDPRLGCESLRYKFSKVSSRVILHKKYSSEVIVENFYRIRTHFQREIKSRTPRSYGTPQEVAISQMSGLELFHIRNLVMNFSKNQLHKYCI